MGLSSSREAKLLDLILYEFYNFDPAIWYRWESVNDREARNVSG